MIKALEKYLPPRAVPIISDWIKRFGVHFIVTPPRHSKKGDYTPISSAQGYRHRITVNGNLNKWTFLVTTIHEFAHLLNWEANQNKVRPHGKEWKTFYKGIMQPFLDGNIFPLDIQESLREHMRSPRASTSSDINLMRLLYSYSVNEEECLIDTLPIKARFLYQGRKFKKEAVIKSKYRCCELATKDYYLFHPTAEVKPL